MFSATKPTVTEDRIYCRDQVVTPELGIIQKTMRGHRASTTTPGGKAQAAVAMILRENKHGIEMLLIERSKREKDPWSGHLAFPGGHVEAGDTSLRKTAERETREEVGINLRCADFLGQLDDVKGATIPVVVSGYIYHITGPVRLNLDAEVQDAFWISLCDLLDPDRHVRYQSEFRGHRKSYAAIDLLGPGRPLLWGLTFRLVTQFCDLLNCSIPGTK